MRAPIQFFAPGEVMTQGSKTAFRAGRRIVLVEQSDKATKTRKGGALKRWRKTIALYARAAKAMHERAYGELDLANKNKDPVRVTLVFALQRKKTVRDAFPVTGGDLDKCARAALDSMTGILYSDDSRVCSLDAYKVYTQGSPGVYVQVHYEATMPCRAHALAAAVGAHFNGNDVERKDV